MIDLHALNVLPIAPTTAKIAVFFLALGSLITGNIAYKRVSRAYKENDEIPRQRYHIALNVLTVLGAAYLSVGKPSHEGLLTLMFALTAFISGIFTYRSMQVQMDRGDEELDKPVMHALSGLVLVLYSGYIWIWEAIGIGGLIFA
ncbi:MAG: hypothetical protein SV760_04110 [Halobacteria archaeon]|nr:hypothetical protein [Halobacteria archaeon]